jgi:hypothetical protein
MATNRIPRPCDPLALAKLIGDIATGQVVDGVEDGKDAQAAAKGHKGSAARAHGMSAAERSETAALAPQARWRKSRS